MQNTYKLILNSKTFHIPTNFQFLSDINQDILNVLSTKHEYYVESKVSNDVFTNFINNWARKEPLDLNINNIGEFNQLSHEFDLIKDQIQLFNKFQFEEIIKKKNHLQQKLTSKIKTKKKLKSKQDQMIDILFNKNEVKTYPSFLKIKRSLYKACIDLDICKANFLVSKKVKNGCFLYSIDEKNKTAGLLNIISESGDVIIPRSLVYDSKEYVITSIKKWLIKKTKIDSIKFSEDSELPFIEKCSFHMSSVSHLVLPASLIEIKKKAFLYTMNLKTIELPENSQLQKIGAFAFQFSGIKCIKIPSKVVRIEEKAFNTRNLEIIEFADHSELEYIGNYAFSDTLITQIIIPSSVKEICDGAFYNCLHLKTIEFQKSFSNLKSIENGVFYSSSLNSLSIPSCVEHFGERWCSGFKNLINFTIIENNVKNISNYNDTFIFGKSDLSKDVFDVLLFARRDVKKVTIPSFIKRIAPYAFQNCLNLESVDFENDSQLKIINSSAFGNTNIKKMTLPSSIVEFGENWIEYNSTLCDINIINNKEQNIIYYDNKFILGKTNLKKNEFDVLIFARRYLKEVTIPSFIKRIGSCAFQRCKYLKTVIFNDDSKLQFIGTYAFNESSIERVKIPSTVHTIESFAFYECLNLTSVDFKDDSELEIINKFLFACSSIKTIFIPSKVRSIEAMAFSSCDNLENITFSKNSRLQKICESPFFKAKLERISIPSSVTMIDYAFFEAEHLKTVEISKDSKLQIIGKNSFSCSKIESIFIPAHIKIIKSEAFKQCENLKKVVFADNSELRYIGSHTFDNTAIETITIPSNVSKIKHNSFSHCKNLITVDFPQNTKLTTISEELFDSSSIEFINIPPNIIKVCRNAFRYSYNLKKVTFPYDTKLQSIESGAFCMSTIETLNLPSNVVLDEGWCEFSLKLKNVLIMKQSGKNDFINYQDKFILGKLNQKSNIYDVLVFSRRDIKEAFIPSFIKKIAPNAFDMCEFLTRVEFEENSKLQIIGNNSFTSSNISRISIPSSVNQILNLAFGYCTRIKYVMFSKNSKLELIGKEAFRNSSIESFVIPSSVIALECDIFLDCDKLQIVEIDENSKLSSFNLQAFNKYSLSIIMIPFKIKKLAENIDDY